MHTVYDTHIKAKCHYASRLSNLGGNIIIHTHITKYTMNARCNRRYCVLVPYNNLASNIDCGYTLEPPRTVYVLEV